MVYYFIGGSVPSGTGRLPCPTQGIPKSTGVSSLSLWNGITWYNFGGIPYVYIYICVCVCTVYTHVYTPASNTPKSYSYIPIISAIISYILIISIISQWNHEKSMKIRPHQCFRILWKEKPPLHLFNFLIELPASSTQVPWLLITFPPKKKYTTNAFGRFSGYAPSFSTTQTHVVLGSNLLFQGLGCHLVQISVISVYESLKRLGS